MAIESYAQQLERVQAAIAAIESGEQSFEINGRVVRRADLKTLYDREAYLRRMVEREKRGGIRLRRVVNE